MVQAKRDSPQNQACKEERGDGLSVTKDGSDSGELNYTLESFSFFVLVTCKVYTLRRSEEYVRLGSEGRATIIKYQPGTALKVL